MTIDTAEKRRSISGIGGPPLIPGVTPNSSKDQEWRQQSGWSYSGIPSSTIIIVLGPYCVEAAEVFIAGMVSGEIFVATKVVGDVFIAGAEAGEGSCN